MITTERFGFSRSVSLSPALAEARITETLKSNGFGVLTRIDFAATLKEKIGAEMPPYVILGACNPRLAHAAVSAEPAVGLLLPCNVIVYEDAHGATQISVIDPSPMMEIADNPGLGPVADEARKLLWEALEAV